MRMRKMMAALTLAATLLLLPRVAEAQAPRRNRGLDITLGIGAAGCTDFYCSGFDMSAQTRLEVLFRVVRYFSVGAHVGFQFLAPDRNLPGWVDLGWSMFIGPEVRGILPVGPMEAWIAITAGYMRIQIEEENDSANEPDQEWGNGFAIGFGFGVQYFVHRRIALGLDFWLYKGFFGELCEYENDGADTTTCTETSRQQRADIGVVFTVGANITFFIPL